MNEPPRQAHDARRLPLVAVIIVAVALTAASATTIRGDELISPWNPALGVGAAFVMRYGAAAGIPVAIAQLAVAFVLDWATPAGNGPAVALALAALPTGVGLILRHAIDQDPDGWTVRHMVTLILIAMFTGIVAGISAIPFAAGPTSAAAQFPLVVGTAVGIVLGVPVVSSVIRIRESRGAPRPGPGVVPDIAAHVIVTLGVGAAAFVLRGPTGERFWSLYFIPLLWTAFRFGMHGIALQQALVSASAIALAALLATPYSTLTNYHFFLFNFTATALLLGAALGARNRAERGQIRSEALLESAFRVTDEGLVLFRRATGEMLDMNDAWPRLVGRPRDALTGASFYTLPEWDGNAGSRLAALARDGPPDRDFHATLRSSPDAPRRVLAIVEAVNVEAGEFGVAFVRDVTERLLLERQRQQSQKLEAVGRLAGGVAHDFNNILTVVRTSAHFLRDTLGPTDPRREEADAILDASAQGADLTRQLLAFARPRVETPPVAIDATLVIAGMERMLERLLGAQIRIETSLEKSVRIVAAPGQLEQVVLNLIVNARDATQPGGAVVVRLATETLTQPRFEPSIGDTLTPGAWATLTVSDTGSGIDPAILSRIFDPFFSTKAEAEGTGLGLATVYGIVRGAGGHVGVVSALGLGTTMRVFWPSPLA